MKLRNRAAALVVAALMAFTLTGTAVAQRNGNGNGNNRDRPNRGDQRGDQRGDRGRPDSRSYRPNNRYRGGSGGFFFQFGTPRRPNYYRYYSPRYVNPPCGYYDRRGFWRSDPNCYYGYYGPY